MVHGINQCDNIMLLDVDVLDRVLKEIGNAPPGQKGPLVALLVAWMVRDVGYYLVLGVVVFALGQRIVGGMLAAWKESKRVRA